MKQIHLTAVLCIGVAAFAQEVRFDYDHSANFSAYKTYEWVDYKPVQIGDQLMDRDIKRAVDAQLAGKGLRRVDTGGEFDGLGWGGPPWFGNWGNTRVTTSTIEIGTLAIGLFDPATKQLVWRGLASKTLDMTKDPDKNYRTLEKAMAKLFKNYPPSVGKTK
jgi:hypothetical protein